MIVLSVFAALVLAAALGLVAASWASRAPVSVPVRAARRERRARR